MYSSILTSLYLLIHSFANLITYSFSPLGIAFQISTSFWVKSPPTTPLVFFAPCTHLSLVWPCMSTVPSRNVFFSRAFLTCLVNSFEPNFLWFSVAVFTWISFENGKWWFCRPSSRAIPSVEWSKKFVCNSWLPSSIVDGLTLIFFTSVIRLD